MLGFVLLLLLGLFLRYAVKGEHKEKAQLGSKFVLGLSVLAFASLFLVTVPAGHVKVATLFGKVQPTPYEAGIHFPVSPLYVFSDFDTKQKTLKFDAVKVPSQDQLISKFDVSVQLRLIPSKTPEIKATTGTANDAVAVHVVPLFRSLLREQGKSVANAEEFFSDSVQERLQAELMTGMTEKLAEVGVEIQNILIRNIELPPFIAEAVEQKKRREQEAEKQKAELARFTTEQEQKIATAEAEKNAAVLEAEKIEVLAKAEAFKIRSINDELARSAEYINLKKVEGWDGKLPQYTGGDNMPIIDLRSNSK